MLQLARNSTTFSLVSDDEHGENDILGQAIEEGAPHLLKQYEETALGDDGLLRIDYPRDEWLSLLEILESLEAIGFVDPDAVRQMAETVEAACNE